MSGGPIPASPLPLAARAPGKCILFGEHAVVHGRPELLLAIDLYTQLLAAPGETMRLNGEAGALRDNPYLSRAMEEIGAAGRRPGSQINAVYLWSTANIYLVGRKLLTTFGLADDERLA